MHFAGLGLGESKSISVAFVKIKPQNELGYIILEPCVDLNRFRVINKLVSSFLFRGLYRNGGSRFISMALATTNPQKK